MSEDDTSYCCREMDKVRAELSTARARIAELKGTDAKRVDEYNTLLGVIVAARAENEALRKRVGELEAEIMLHNEAYKAMLARAEQAEAQLAVMREALENIGRGGPCTTFQPSVDIARTALQQTSPATITGAVAGPYPEGAA
jgi:chromosome segregation ATPase